MSPPALLDNRLLSAPTIESKITDRGRINGGAMTEQDVKAIVAILSAGKLPYTIKLVAEEPGGE
jgi:preprotein translocase subunit SecD